MYDFFGKKKMRLLIMLPAFQVGGVETFCSLLSYQLSKREDVELHLIVFRDSFASKFSWLKENESIKLHVLNKRNGFSLSFLRDLNGLITKINPDVINSHSSHAFRYLIFCPCAKKVPIVHTVTSNPYIYSKLCFPFYKLRLHQKSWNITLIAISRIIAERLVKLYKIPPSMVTTIYNGIVPSQRQTATPERRTRLLTCASLTEVKNQRLMLDGFAIALKQNPALKLTIAGSGPKESELIQQSKNLGIDNAVTFVGTIDDMTHFYQKFDYFLLSSKSEGNPLVIAEAMSAGLPVLATPVGGVPDLVENGINGFLTVQNCTPSDYAEGITKLCRLSKSEYQKISDANIRKASAWDIKLISEEYLELFAKLVNEDRIDS